MAIRNCLLWAFHSVFLSLLDLVHINSGSFTTFSNGNKNESRNLQGYSCDSQELSNQIFLVFDSFNKHVFEMNVFGAYYRLIANVVAVLF